THISGLSHTRGKESDLIAAMAEGISKLGIYVENTQDSILISPARSKFKPADVDSQNDNRIAMSLERLGLTYPGVIVNIA
ncbi:3-phosphoshikimate 1-carboxyvinyltransferase, partial [Francisella tularensis subsp. holarctica]|nr:3-phosphoshikimate 1-carboxyvinyltransferase [Francisella tularensis subsp. holarctica]